MPKYHLFLKELLQESTPTAFHDVINTKTGLAEAVPPLTPIGVYTSISAANANAHKLARRLKVKVDPYQVLDKETVLGMYAAQHPKKNITPLAVYTPKNVAIKSLKGALSGAALGAIAGHYLPDEYKTSTAALAGTGAILGAVAQGGIAPAVSFWRGKGMIEKKES